MIALKLTAVLAALTFAKAEFDMVACCQKALAVGVDGLLPNHDPFHFPNRSFSTTILDHAFNFTMQGFTWTNIPWWNATSELLSDPSDPFLAYSYNLYWKQFVISGNLDFTLDDEDDNVDLTITMDHVNWSGNWNMTKATSDKTAEIQNLTLKMEIDNISAEVTNLSVIEQVVDEIVAGLWRELIEVLSSTNLLGQGFMYKMNTDWLAHPDKLQKLQAWCEAN